MKYVRPEQVLDQRKQLFPFCLILLLLLGVGLASLYSASYYQALRTAGDPAFFLRRQLVFALLGCAGGVIMMFIPYNVLRWMIPAALALSLILMLLTLFSPLGDERLGARRWLSLGPVSLQPSEVVKLSVVLFLANYLGKHGERMKEFTITLLPVALILLFSGLIMLQRDFSTALLFGFVTIAMVAASQTKKLYLVYLLLLLAVPGIMLLLTEEYRLRRVIGFLFPETDPTGINYQVNMSLRAIASGGILGTGFGLGTMKLGAIPEVSSDFIFASFAQETGLVGVTAVWLLFLFLGYIGFKASAMHRKTDRRLFFLGFGCTAMITWQAMLNMAVAVGLIPPTGLPLPFFSLGGTNLTVLLIMCGCIARVIYTPVEQYSRYSGLDLGGYQPLVYN